MKIPLLLIYFSLFVLIVLAFIGIKKSLVFYALLYSLFFLLGVTLLKSHDYLGRNHITKYVNSYFRQVYTIKGWVTTEPETNFFQANFILRAKAIKSDQESHYCSGNILVRFKGKKELHYGDELLIRGNLYRPFSNKDFPTQSYLNYLNNQGIYLILSVKSDADIVSTGKNKGLAIKKLALSVKGMIKKIFLRYTQPVYASILEAMILGEKKNIPPLVINSMMKTGTVHILVVSGFNVGITAFVIVMFLKLIRVPKKTRFCFVALLLVVYCLATGASNPVLRATVMAMVFLFAPFLKREANVYHALSIAALFILGLNPRQIFDIGFQLSFVSVLAIVFFYPKLKKFCGAKFFKNRLIGLFFDGLLVSLSAWLGTVGLVAYYFGIVSPISALANIFIVPLATIITLLGFSLIFISLFFPPLATYFAHSAELSVALLLKINAFLVKLPGAYFYIRG